MPEAGRYCSMDNCRDHAHTKPPLAQMTVRGEKKCGHPILYTAYAGCAITTGIPMKFGTAHGRSRLELVVRNALTSMGAEGFPGPPLSSGILSEV